VKKWRNIVLTINAFRPEVVAVPDLVDLPLRQAIAMIEDAGLEMGALRYKADLSINVVLSQLHNGKDAVPGDLSRKAVSLTSCSAKDSVTREHLFLILLE
jgi:hypothetical protein